MRIGDMGRLSALALLAVSLVGPRPVCAQTRVTIFIGPQVRDGFVDVDQGVLDSVRDIKAELRAHKTLTVVDRKDGAQITLDVVSRGETSASGGGTVGVPIGTMTIYAPVATQGIATVLHVGAYERPIVFSNCEPWRRCARAVTKDVEAWVAANVAAIR